MTIYHGEKGLFRSRLLHVAVAAMPLLTIATSSFAAYNVTISSGTTNNGTLSGGVFTPTGHNAVLNVTDLKNALTTSDVTINTGTSGSQTGDITFKANLAWPANKLTADAFHSVIISAKVHAKSVAGFTIKTNDGGTGGVFVTDGGRVWFDSASQSLTINGSAYTLVPDIVTFVADDIGDQFGKFALMDNYDAAGGLTYTRSPFSGSFLGTLDGLGNTISNLKIVISSTTNAGQVAFISQNSGTIRDLNFTNALVTSSVASPTGSIIGVVVAANYGAMFGVSAQGSVSAGPIPVAGGLVGAVVAPGGNIFNSSADVAVTGTTDTVVVGDLAGVNAGVITDCLATGDVSITASPHPNRRTAPTTLTYAVGGLVGRNQTTGSITTSYATGSATGLDGYNVGGLVGWNYAIINNTYALGAVQTGATGTAGGLVGLESSPGGIGSSYSAGAPSGGGSAIVGGFVGEDDFSGSISTSYWDTTSSGITSLSQGAGSPANDSGITGLSDTVLKSGLPSGFSSSLWGQSATINSGLPYLLDIPPS